MFGRKFTIKLKLVGLRMKVTNAFWVNGKYKFLRAKEIDNDYLKKIVYTICERRGWSSFITKKRIDKIFKEVYKRNLFRQDETLSLHSAALYIWGYENKAPKYIRSWDGVLIPYSDFITKQSV